MALPSRPVDSRLKLHCAENRLILLLTLSCPSTAVFYFGGVGCCFYLVNENIFPRTDFSYVYGLGLKMKDYSN